MGLRNILYNTHYDEYTTSSLSGLHCTTWLATYLSIREWLQYSYLETGLNCLTSAAVMQWHADTPWQQTLCPSLLEPQIVNAFKSDYVAAATAAEARISFELRPTITWLWSSLFTAENYCVFGRKRKCPKPSKIVIFGAKNENENEFRSVSTLESCQPRFFSPLPRSNCYRQHGAGWCCVADDRCL